MPDYKTNAEENYSTTPISVLSYISQLEFTVKELAYRLEYEYAQETKVVNNAKQLIKSE